jgi:hypothetical protein
MARKLIVVLVILSWVGVALAQETRGGRKHRRGGDRAPASSPSHPTDPRTAAFLRRVDTNRNGMIDDDEISGAAKTIVEGILTRLGIEVKYPVSLSRIVVASGKRHPQSRDDDDAESSSEDESPTDNSGPAPSANGFGTAKPSLPAVPGFGQATREPPNGSETKSAAPSTKASTATKSTRSSSAKANRPPSETATASDPSADSPKRTGPKSGRFLTPHERLSKGMPEWFREKDGNHDGQVDMAEYASEWTADLVEEFNRYDLNHDGIITPDECLKAEGSHHKSK